MLDWEMLRRFKIERGFFFLRSASLPGKRSVMGANLWGKKPLFNIISLIFKTYTAPNFFFFN
jgi:hypothetical protein